MQVSVDAKDGTRKEDKQQSPLFPSPPCSSVDETLEAAVGCVSAPASSAVLVDQDEDLAFGLAVTDGASDGTAAATAAPAAQLPPALLAGDRCKVVARSDKAECTTGLIFKKDPRHGGLLVAFDDGCWES
eukprot:4227893-Pleurochrysis_carterae.AAC.1